MVETKFFVWKPEFNLGNPVIDAEHQRFFEITNRLYAATSAGAPRTELSALFDELLAHAITHFAHEERLLAEMHYIGVGIQRKLHGWFMQEFGNLPSESPSCHELAVIKDWMLNHILETDRHYVAWMTTRADERGSVNASGLVR